MSAQQFRLLIADDEYWVRENLANLLDWQAMMITLIEPAVDGEEAALKIRTEHPDILITDISMPFMNGNELIRFAKGLNPQISIIVLSGYSDFSFVRDALLCGAVDYLLKPISKNALLDAVEKSIAALGSGREREREKADLDERLLRASSLMRDRELSALIAEDGPENPQSTVVSDLELSNAGFTLVLIKMIGFPVAARELAPRRIQQIKNAVTKLAEGSTVFHNLYVRNEFVLLTSLRGEKLAHVCSLLPGKVQSYSGFPCCVAVSGFHYSFVELRSAYRDARFSLSMRPVSRECRLVRLDEAKRVAVQKRISPEQENRLLFGLQSGNKRLAREVIADQIGLARCGEEKWLIAEVNETAQYLAAVIFHHATLDASSLLAMENLRYLLDAALESLDVQETFSLLEQALDEAFDEAPGPGASESMRRTIRRVQSYIEEKYFGNLSLTSLSTVFNVERSYLSKAFKQVTGVNLMLAIAKVRIEKAKEYIRGEGPDGRDLSFADVASLVGYDEYTYFNRVFRKITGSSPSEYKVAVQQGDSK